MAKEIKLTQGLFTLVDDGDFEFLSQWKWHASVYKKWTYAARTIRIGATCKTVLMHILLNGKKAGYVTDHIDHDGLNNQRSNLRYATFQQNTRNKTSSGFSKFLGVSRYKNAGGILYIGFRAQITVSGQRFCLGKYKEEKDAAIAYNKAAIKFFGDFANINKI